MKIQYTLIAVFSVMTFSLCSESNAQFFRQRFRQVTQPVAVPQPATFSQNTNQNTAVRYAPKVLSPKSYQDLNSGTRYVSNLPETYRKNDKTYDTDLRHVYRPIKGGMKKQGVNGQMLILAEYIGTHRKSPNEKRMGSFQDMQYGSMGQKIVQTDLTGKKMWVVPFLDGTLRWVPLINKD